MDLLVLIYFIYSNCKLAKLQGKSVLSWALLTVLSFFVCYMIGMAIILNLFYDGSLDPKVFPAAFQKFMYENQMRLLLATVMGLGGALFIRYLLEQQKNNTPVDEE